MQIELTKQVPSIDELKKKLTTQFPEYEFKNRNSFIIMARKSSTAGAMIIIRKNKLTCGEAFPTMGGQMLFTLFMILLGILIPLIIYYTTIFKGQKEVATNIGTYLTKEYAG